MMPHQLHIIGLTGGIATGKSTCCRLIRQEHPELVLFDADACVKGLYEKTSVVGELKTYFGGGLMLPCGGIDKAYLRQCVCADPSAKSFLEQVFHPRVIKECLALLSKSAKNPSSRLFVADVPLLFEIGFDIGQSANLLVATSRKTQVDRLKKRNAWDDDTVDAMLSSQMHIDAKLALADVIFWNEGPVEILRAQCRRWIQSLGIHPS
ncbi:MAG: dephospho-CoA kinase [Verrucomicrobiae bacterium]|nr:dephospho-CoA kinase [Verrucomicrobiae bacterium]NNJ43523.1 dephospho-CoA kinase [Akkermansiaceae bacterium]